MKGSVKMEADFSGYATKAGLKCSDGRTIMPGAFKHQDKMKVPLVWQHGHTDPENVLGHTMLENRDDGVYAYGFFNKSGKADHARNLIEHGDISMLSIWANELVERSGRVLHGAIREVSLVLSGANPGAVIENVTIRHSDGDETTLEDEVIIYTGLEIEHATADDPKDDNEETIQDIYDSMTTKQKDVFHFMLGQALENAQNTVAQSNVEHDNVDDDSTDTNQEGNEMTRNVFEKADVKPEVPTLSHSDIEGIVADATKLGSLKDAVEAYAISHGINDIDILFPDARAIGNVPEFFARRTEWVNKVLGGTRKSPFSRIKTLSADITVEEARAKGYIKGNLKKEEFFGVAKRVTIPTTIYKKQKLDRDDMVDITDFDVVAWLKAEMRLMLDEELARAVLIGDGRDVANDDKINEQNIRPIAKDHELYTTVINVNIDDANSSVAELIDSVVANRQFYRGTGLPTMYTTETYISKFLTLKDTIGRRIYKTLDEVATELRVSEIVPVEVMEEEPNVVAILVNMTDYVLGADKGGSVAMFDDFDIDYNQYKYLIETRCSGALTKLKSAMVINKVAATLISVTPNQPAFDGTTVTITAQTGVIYQDASDDSVLNAGPHAVPNGETLVVNAVPAATHYFPSSEGDTWTFTNPA
ncbi:MAG: caudovirus prohead protease [Paenisporosarcina sp.]